MLSVGCLGIGGAQAQHPLSGSRTLAEEEDWSERMASSIGRLFDQATVASPAGRAAYWRPDFSDRAAYETSVRPNRERLARLVGLVDERVQPSVLTYVATVSQPALRAETEQISVYAVRWQVFGDVYGEGLLLQPKGEVVARVVALPDADQPPEVIAGLAAGLPPELQYARRLAENGCQVIVPTLVDRSSTFSGNERLRRYTNQPHREWIYRQAYTFGRHIIGYEVQKVLGAIDWLAAENRERPVPLAVAGWGEGGLLAFYSAALDTRINAALVSGYFDKRERLWTEPVYRNLFGLLKEFGDAEIARLIVPRTLIIEHARAPQVEGPPPALAGVAPRLGASAAAGRIVTPIFAEVADEVVRAKQLAGPFRGALQFFYRDSHQLVGAESDRTIGPMAESSLTALLRSARAGFTTLAPPGPAPAYGEDAAPVRDRQQRQVSELERHTQRQIELSRGDRDAFLWQKVRPTDPAAWDRAMGPYRERFWNELNGRLPAEANPTPLNPRTRRIHDRPTWTGYEVVLDVRADLFVWGYLLVPKGIKPGERRPVIIAQHGGTGLPSVVINEDSATNRAYKAYAVQMAERGFVVFAPHFPWRTMDRFFRVAERKANPLGLTTFSVIFEQHERLLDWLSEQPWVDPQRIGFYGLSWGGKLAMRVPAVVKRYALSICSGDFNEWVWKVATTGWGNSYLYVPEYETLQFNLGRTFGYAEMAAMIAPRAFMVERGHDDGVGIDEWVAFEYAKVNRLYAKLGIPERTTIEYFDGGHEIRAVGALEFIQRQFRWPESASPGTVGAR